MNSRYYNPETGRFINADNYVSTGQGVLGYNMFEYCLNNSVKRKDETGTRAELATKGVGSGGGYSSNSVFLKAFYGVESAVECGEKRRHGLRYHMHRNSYNLIYKL